MTVHTVIITKDTEGSEMVTLFDEVHNPIPYIRTKLSEISNAVADSINNIKTINQAVKFVTENSIPNIKIYVVDNINPKEI